MPRGFVGLIIELHHPLPPPGEGPSSRWAAAAAETYWPLLRAVSAAADAGLAEVATIAVSASWLALAADPEAQELARRELTRRADQDSDSGWSWAWRQLLEFADDRWSLDPIAVLRRAGASGAVELIPMCASHAWLPAVAQHPIVARAQVATAADDFAARLAVTPQGLWLPHLGYPPGFERLLAERGLRYFAVDGEAARRGTARSPMDLFGPLITAVGTAAFPIDPTSCGPLEDRAHHHRLHRPRLDHSTAVGAAAEFATNWVAAWRDSAQARAPRASGPPPINLGAISADDLRGKSTLVAEWLERVLFALAAHEDWPPTTPARYLDRFPEHPVGRPGPSAGGAISVRPNGSDLLGELYSAAEVLTEFVDQNPSDTPLAQRAISQLTRLLLLAQSLDWHVPAGDGVGAELGLVQARARLADFAELAGSFAAGRLDAARLAALEYGPPYLTDLTRRQLIGE